MELLAVLGLAALLFVKEAGVPIPIPGDLLVLGAGVATAGNIAGALVALVAILIAGYLGGSVQFVLVRGALRRVVMSLLVRFGVPLERIDRLAQRLRRTGARGVAVARVTPGVRVPAIAASGLAALPLPAFVVGLVAGNTLFVGAHFALGFIVGAPAVALIQSSGTLLIAAGIVGLAIVGAIGWIVIRRRRKGSGEPLAAWTDAACPACLTLAALGLERQSD